MGQKAVLDGLSVDEQMPVFARGCSCALWDLPLSLHRALWRLMSATFWEWQDSTAALNLMTARYIPVDTHKSTSESFLVLSAILYASSLTKPLEVQF